MHYALISAAVVMFGIGFLFNDRYEKESGSSFAAALLFTLFGNIAGLLVLLPVNGFRIEATPFTLLMAGLATLNTVLYSFCSLKALAHINLSLYSIFAMLGGMVLPFAVGIIFYDEPLTYGNVICLILIAAALALTIKRGDKKQGYVYYVGVFILNGMSGVLSKAFLAAPYAKASEASYSIWMAILAIAACLLLLLPLYKQIKRPSAKAFGYTLGCGAINKFANYLLLLALAVLPASVQYPFVTGGTMIVSTLFALFLKQKPTKQEIAAIALSFLGILILILI